MGRNWSYIHNKAREHAKKQRRTDRVDYTIEPHPEWFVSNVNETEETGKKGEKGGRGVNWTPIAFPKWFGSKKGSKKKNKPKTKKDKKNTKKGKKDKKNKKKDKKK